MMNKPIFDIAVPPIKRAVPVPKIYNPPKFSIDKFFKVVKDQTGYESEQILQVLSINRLAYTPDRFWELVKVVINHYQEVVDNRINGKPDNEQEKFPVDCPVCGAMTTRDPLKDRRFGVIRGWKCSANRFHFQEYQWAHLQAWLTRNASLATEEFPPYVEET